MLQILQKIIQERVSAGLYRSGMVKILGVSQQVYSNIEAGKVKKLAAEDQN
jgi:DNA-binding XRE family transcriptional regulator